MSIHPVMQRLADKLKRTDFPFNSKVIDKIEKIRSYRVRRAKLFYIRGLRGKAARLKEVDRVTGKVRA